MFSEFTDWLTSIITKELVHTTMWHVIYKYSINVIYRYQYCVLHYSDVMMSTMASQITGISSVYSTVCCGADQRKHQSLASLVFVRGIHRCPVNSPHKGPVTQKMFPFDDVIMVKLFDTHHIGVHARSKHTHRYIYIYACAYTWKFLHKHIVIPMQ